MTAQTAIEADEPKSKRARVENADDNDEAKTVGRDDTSTSVISDLPPIVVSSRKSALALYQTNFVIDKLKRIAPGREFPILKESTLGDKVLNRHLSDLGRDAPGLFTKELEVQLLNKQAR